MENLIIGSHVSFQKATQLVGSVHETISYGGNCFMIYTGAPQNTVRGKIDQTKTKQAQKLMLENGIVNKHNVVHAPYIINLANGSSFAVDFLAQEIDRCAELGIDKIVVHPGSHVKLSKEAGIKNIIAGLNKIIKKDQAVYVCLETMAGKGTEIGASFSELKQIMDGVIYSEKIKICLDTCHMHDAGYDISDFDTLLKQFATFFAFEKIACVHINDSKNISGSHKDRHENIGFGDLGFKNLLQIIYHPWLENVPKILETPYISKAENDKAKIYPPYKFEIAMIKAQTFDPEMKEKVRRYY